MIQTKTFLISQVVVFFVAFILGYAFHKPGKSEVVVSGTLNQVSTTAVSQVPKEVDKKTGKPERTDFDIQTGKNTIIVKLNGKEMEFKKDDTEKYALEKNKISLIQGSRIDFEIKPQSFDFTKRWGLLGGGHWVKDQGIKPDIGLQFPLYKTTFGAQVVGWSDMAMINAIMHF